MSRRGFTLVELIVGVILTGIVGTTIFFLLTSSQRAYQMQTERTRLNNSTRATVAILPAELRELNAADTLESDILEMTATSVAFKAMRGLFFVCQQPTGAGPNGTVVLWRNPVYGLRTDIDETRDSVLIFAEGDASTRTDNYWIHANVNGAPATGTACPGGGASITLTLNRAEPGGSMGDIGLGAPLRTYEVVRLSTYTDGLGDLWLGGQRYTKGGPGYGTIQPLLGPLAASGLQLTYLDQFGATTAIAAQVAQIGVVVIGQTAAPIQTPGGLVRAVDTLITSVALRNNLK